SLLGVRGAPVFPMTTAGPSESYLGDPTWTTLAEWADEARRKDGLVVIPHFPNPYCEVAADIVQGKIDAVEINMQDFFLQIGEWYRYLNCGYRVAAVGGTDKMGAYMPVGAIRTYARLSDDAAGAPFTFDAWSAAVRAGRTFTTTGPLIDLRVEGHAPGDEVRLPEGGGTLHVTAEAESVVPFSRLEIVMNGQVVAAQRAAGGALRASLSLPLEVPGSAWIAARCTGELTRWIGSPRPVAAHTSPVYVVAGDGEQFSPSDATYMLTLLEGGLTWLDTLSVPADAERQARNRKVFEDAREALHRRLHAAGHDHGPGQHHAH
ncbi:MAG TPA: CehA/McbA family metallohydrolase, partial [Chloroflexota bacterium]|nr:CehA/McbA family metallohydrolase [Chloroflexota bacterium]